MKLSALAAFGAAAVALAACVPPNVGHGRGGAGLKPVARLDCPASQGVLKRVSAAADGKSCAYVTDDGSQVELTLTPVSSDPRTVLDDAEAQLKTLVSLDSPPPAPAAPPAPGAPPAPPAPPGDADRVDIDLPGVAIKADDGKANIHVGGIHIDADDRTDSVHMHGGHGRGGQFVIDANDAGAIIRARSGGRDVRDSLILASDKAGPQGWKAVGYEAMGPRSGPLVLGVVKSKGDRHGGVFGDLKSLVRHAAGGRPRFGILID